MNTHIERLHNLARTGAVSADAAERQINTYLLMPSVGMSMTCQRPVVPLAWLQMPLADAPHHTTMPDLGAVLHSVLTREQSTSSSLKLVVELCIPRFRHLARPISFTDSQSPLIGLVLGLLLGLYSGCVKKPRFSVRAKIFSHLREIMVSPGERQTEFCVKNEALILFGCMEYMARVLPMFMPTLFQVICEGDPHIQAFYKRIPPLADELRQWIDTGDETPTWPEIIAECKGKMDRITRLKRGGGQNLGNTGNTAETSQFTKSLSCSTTRVTDSMLSRAWNTPQLGPTPTPNEFALLGMDIGVPGGIIRWVQQEVRVTPLPSNLKAMQLDGIRRKGITKCRASYLQTHWPICVKCIFTRKHTTAAPSRLQLRLDTVSRSMVCAACLSRDIVYVDLLGRTMRYHATTFFVCPECVTVQPYTSPRQQPWGGTATGDTPGCLCQDASPKQRHGKQPKGLCCVCGESSQANPIRRVDHLTAQMRSFYFCQRHTPRADAVRCCANARQLEGVELRPTSRVKR